MSEPAYSMEAVLGGHAKRLATLAANSNPFAEGVAWVEGRLYPLHEARIPILDQGFLRSDLTYDVPAVWDGRFFRLDDHLNRLEQSCEKMRLRIPLPREQIRQTLLEMVAKSGIRDAYVELIMTRGLKFVREYESYENNLYLLVMPYVWAMPPEYHPRGGHAVVTRTVRRTPPGAMDPTIKNLQWGDFVRGWLEAMDRGAVYALLPDGDGNITEGGGYNIFVVKDGVLSTPSRGVLQGVTRRTVLEICAERGWPTVVDFVPVDSLYQADEIFICTTAGGVMPITRLDDQPVGGGQVGPITREVWEAYWKAHYDPRYSFAVDYG
ncbi:aminotransferase class IV [Phenylobacterium sp.]|uniref:aminotransferase class IV n=1 Tax=Phenylobacterium sp. TaxID=1871053 RepID=UPI002C4D944A|nr:aminotransferase class IV [Phenylobacterium sp.]HVI33613.1 aminotransferase class IV [Phenylobacterium sp.]